MWNPFKSKPLLSEEDRAFQYESYKWLLTHFGGPYFYDTTRLVLPTDQYFPTEVSSNLDAAQSTFKCVALLVSMKTKK